MNKTSRQLIVIAVALVAGGVFVVSQVKGGVTLGLTSLTSSMINKTLTTNSDLNNGLVLHYTFDGSNMIDNVADSSGTGNTAFLVGQNSGTTTTTGNIGQGLTCDGLDDYVDGGSNASIDDMSQVSAFMWVDTKSESNDFFIGKTSNNTQGWYLTGTTIDTFRVFIQFDTTDIIQKASNNTLDVLEDGEWHHVGFTWDGTTNASGVNIFVDGAEVGYESSQEGEGAYESDEFVDVSICGKSDGVNYQTGVDDVRVYNRVLSTDEISRLYDLGSGTKVNKTIEKNTALNENLVGHWTFDGPDLISNVADSSSSGNTGYLVQDQGTTTTAGKIGQGIHLDGVSDYVSIDDSASLSFGNGSTDSPFSVSAWVHIDDSLTTQRFVGKADATNDGEWLFTTTGADVFGFFMFDQSATAFIGRTYSSSLPTGEWIHLTGTYDGSKTASGVNLYLNGSDVDDADSTSGTYDAMESTSKEVKIGRYGATYLDGKIDDVRIYNKELTATEVQRIYDLGK